MNAIVELGERPEIQILACDAKVAKEANLNYQSCESVVHQLITIYIGVSGMFIVFPGH